MASTRPSPSPFAFASHAVQEPVSPLSLPSYHQLNNGNARSNPVHFNHPESNVATNGESIPDSEASTTFGYEGSPDFERMRGSFQSRQEPQSQGHGLHHNIENNETMGPREETQFKQESDDLETPYSEPSHHGVYHGGFDRRYNGAYVNEMHYEPEAHGYAEPSGADYYEPILGSDYPDFRPIYSEQGYFHSYPRRRRYARIYAGGSYPQYVARHPPNNLVEFGVGGHRPVFSRLSPTPYHDRPQLIPLSRSQPEQVHFMEDPIDSLMRRLSELDQLSADIREMRRLAIRRLEVTRGARRQSQRATDHAIGRRRVRRRHQRPRSRRHHAQGLRNQERPAQSTPTQGLQHEPQLANGLQNGWGRAL